MRKYKSLQDIMEPGKRYKLVPAPVGSGTDLFLVDDPEQLSPEELKNYEKLFTEDLEKFKKMIKGRKVENGRE